MVWHREAQKTQAAPTYEFADGAYVLFLATFATTSRPTRCASTRASWLWALRRWKDAAEQYTKVVEAQPGGKYLREAAFAAVLAWKNANMLGDHASRSWIAERLRAPGEGKVAPQPIPEASRR